MTQPPPQQPTSNQIYNNNGFGELQGAQSPQEPMAANEGFGAFSGF